MGQKFRFPSLTQTTTKFRLPLVGEDKISDGNVKPSSKRIRWKDSNVFRRLKRFNFRKLKLSRPRVRKISPILLLNKIRDVYLRIMPSFAASTKRNYHHIVSGNHMSIPPVADYCQLHRDEDDYQFHRLHIW
ncbi:hypothetical protein O6H91_Y100800 [Diphasiastrum complanatum]|nr:hypothetical protein O6H91_Y100800 [Diphasiastrum complanatum]